MARLEDMTPEAQAWIRHHMGCKTCKEVLHRRPMPTETQLLLGLCDEGTPLFVVSNLQLRESFAREVLGVEPPEIAES